MTGSGSLAEIIVVCPLLLIRARARPTNGSDRGKHDLTLVVRANHGYRPSTVSATTERIPVSCDQKSTLSSKVPDEDCEGRKTK